MNSKAVIASLIIVLFLGGTFAWYYYNQNYTNNPNQNNGEKIELRGTWLNPYAFDSAEKRTATLNLLMKMHINTVFLAAPDIGENYGWSDLESFKAVLQELANNEIKVHIWVANMYRAWGATHEYVDFTDPDELDKQLEWGGMLLEEYNVSGIHFDYIRYKEWDDINATKMNAITNVVSHTYNLIKKDYPGKYLTAAVFPATPNWADFDKEDIPQWYIQWLNDNPGSPYETGNGPYVPENMKFQQDAIFWARENMIDGVMPMAYTNNISEWFEEIQLWKMFGIWDRTFMGIAWYEENGYNLSAVVHEIKMAQSNNARGFVIFELGANSTMDALLLEALTTDGEINDYDAPLKEAAQSPL